MVKFFVTFPKFFYIFYISFLISNVTISGESKSVLTHSLISAEESLVRVVTASHPWSDEQRIFTISKTNMDGHLSWQQNLIVTSGSRLYALVEDPQGNLYLAGRFHDQITLGEQTIKAKTSRSFFLLSITGDGEIRFLRVWESQTTLRLSGLQISPSGELWLSGQGIESKSGQPELDASREFTFWLRFDGLGEIDRALTLGSLANANPITSEENGNTLEEWVFMREGQELPSLLSMRESHLINMGDRPKPVEEDPTTEPDPDPTNHDNPPPSG